MNGGHGQWTLCIPNEFRFCLQDHNGRIRVWRLQVRDYKIVALCMATLVLKLVSSLRVVLDFSVAPYMFECMEEDNTRPHVACNIQEFFCTNQIELFPSPACSPYLSSIANVWFMLIQRLTRDTPPTTISDQLWQFVEAT
ncbi:hypothetical protein TNCV_3367861 [Trichonephila clavipes]|nr:hypothetical protein TNCV_3367861 [Trichonephila clavipes]